MPHKRAKQSVRLAEAAKKGTNLPPSSSSMRDDTPRNAARILNALSAQQKFRERGGRSGEDTGEGPPRKRRKAGEQQSQRGNGSERSNGVARSSDVKGKGKGKASNAATSEPEKKIFIPPIRPHESQREYNFRIETLFRPEVTQAIKSAESIKLEQARLAKEEKAARRKAQGKKPQPEAGVGLAGDTNLDVGGIKRRRRTDEDEGEYLQPEDRPVKTFAPKPGPRRLNDIAQAPPQLPVLRGAAGNEGGGARGKGGAGAFSAVGRDPLNAGQKRLLEEERERVVRRYREMKEEREREKAKAKEKEQGPAGEKSAAEAKKRGV